MAHRAKPLAIPSVLEAGHCIQPHNLLCETGGSVLLPLPINVALGLDHKWRISGPTKARRYVCSQDWSASSIVPFRITDSPSQMKGQRIDEYTQDGMSVLWTFSFGNSIRFTHNYTVKNNTEVILCSQIGLMRCHWLCCAEEVKLCVSIRCFVWV